MDDVTQNVNCTLSFGWRISDLTANSRAHLYLSISMNLPRNKGMHLQLLETTFSPLFVFLYL